MLRIKNIHKLLIKLDIFTTTLGGSKFVTISVVLPVIKSVIQLLKPDDEDPAYICEMKRVSQEDFKTRIQDLLDCFFWTPI